MGIGNIKNSNASLEEDFKSKGFIVTTYNNLVTWARNGSLCGSTGVIDNSKTNASLQP